MVDPKCVTVVYEFKVFGEPLMARGYLRPTLSEIANVLRSITYRITPPSTTPKMLSLTVGHRRVTPQAGRGDRALSGSAKNTFCNALGIGLLEPSSIPNCWYSSFA
jgi:hypothetical protein